MMLSLRRVTGPICLAFTGRPALEGGGERERDADDMAPRLAKALAWRLVGAITKNNSITYKKILFAHFLYTSGDQEYR